jgi:hypothetical protein
VVVDVPFTTAVDVHYAVNFTINLIEYFNFLILFYLFLNILFYSQFENIYIFKHFFILQAKESENSKDEYETQALTA